MTAIALEIEDVKALLDIATNSMDFGSGFLDQGEVETMRRIATALGVDPNVATPENFKKQYAHPYKPHKVWREEPPWDWKTPDAKRERVHVEACEDCGYRDPLPESDPIHHGVDNPAASSE